MKTFFTVLLSLFLIFHSAFAVELPNDNLNIESIRTKRGIVRIGANDQRVSEFPQFAELGDMWWFQGAKLLLSEVAPDFFYFSEAKKFCENLDSMPNPSFWNRNRRKPGGANVPSINQWEMIRQAITAKTSDTPPNYSRILIPGIVKYEDFWTSDFLGWGFYAYYYHVRGGFYGYYEFDDNHRKFRVRCIREIG